MDATADDVGALIARARRSDAAAFETLYTRTVAPVYRYISTRVDAVDEVEELTQEVFFAALRGIRGVRAENETALLGWLFQIARNKLADRLREKYRHPVAPLDEADAVPAAEPGPDDQALTRQDEGAIRVALGRLTDDQREVVVCKYMLGYDNERTAALIGKNANAVNQLHHRALAALHRLLTPTEPWTKETE